MTRIFALAFIVVAAVTVGSPLVAQTDTVFTYQGELKENGGITNGVFNLDFTLWDALAGGNQIGSELMFNALPVVDGRFTVELDFGASAFDNSSRWLEITVNGTELSPRQPIARAPYSIQTRGIFVDDNGNVGLGTIDPSTALHISNTDPQFTLQDTDNNGAAQEGFLSFVDSDDTETAWLGFVEDTNFYIKNTIGDIVLTPGGNDIVFTTDGRVGIGTTSPIRPLTIDSSTNEVGGIRVHTTENSVSGDGVTSVVRGNDAIAIYGRDFSLSGTGRAGLFDGDVDITGTLFKSGGSFKIDHPLDPANKFLSHSFVESPDMMNIYNGNAILDGSGLATITLPDWFEALNREFRYQLTCIGGFATVYVESEIENNQFTIAGGNAGLKVSWQVTGVRQDAWAEANRIPVEEQKVGFEAGHYLHPEVYDLDRSMSILSARDAHYSVPESIAAANEFQDEKQIEETASRITDEFQTPHTKRARQK